MQPYLFPYIGYWQLINTVDTFVIYDDVNFIKQGYINKNNILHNENKQVFSLELIGASSNKLINEIKVGRNSKKLLKSIYQNYSKAPYFSSVYPLIEKILLNKEENIANFIAYSLKEISKYLNISTDFIYSSRIDKNNNLRAQDKVIHICKLLKADKYINAIGGQELYDKAIFEINNININFIKTELKEYKQFKNRFIPYLSIIDVMMFNEIKTINGYLQNYKLI
jgi:hypothetical protein